MGAGHSLTKHCSCLRLECAHCAFFKTDATALHPPRDLLPLKVLALTKRVCWAGEGASAGQLGKPGVPAKPSVRAAPVVVGMQAPEGWDQTYGELSRGPFTPEVDTSTRIHPTHTFLPGHVYAPEVRVPAPRLLLN